MAINVRFKLNKYLDKRMTFEFLSIQQGGINFSRGIINIHTDLSKIKKTKNSKEKKEIIDRYFNLFYKNHNKYLKKRTVEFYEEWKKVENLFVTETQRIFKGHSFPKREYIGYVSIIDCNPRFLKNKTFQVFYNHPLGVKYVTAHELLHFVFYDYVLKKYSKTFRSLDTEQGIFWDLAEIFNSVILQTNNFVKIHNIKKKIIYPEHSTSFPLLAKQWEKNPDIDIFITTGYKILSENKSRYLHRS